MTTQYLNDRYEILQQLGKRTGRETLLARDLSTEKLVVIKLLKFNSEFEWDDLKLFEREALILQELSHPAIPQYLDYFEFEVPQYKGFAIVQTYLEAKSLEQHRKNGRTFSENEVKEIAKQLLEILAYLHDRHPPVIHRDLKPSNILLGDRSAHSIGKIYLVDFGSVQNIAATEGGTFTIVGTYGYMPPEQFGGRTVPASDLYSLGATLIYLLTGRHPADLPFEDLQIQFQQFITGSPQFTSWLNRLLQSVPSQRFAHAREAIKALKVNTVPNVNLLKTSKSIEDLATIVNQPLGSRVKLKNTPKSLEIILPPQGFHPALIPTIGFAFVWNLFLVNWYRIAFQAWSSGGWFMALFSLVHLGVGLSLIWTILFTLSGKTKLEITKNKVSITHEILGLKLPRFAKKCLKTVDKIELTRISYKRNSEGDRVLVPPQINIWAGVKKIQLGQGGRLSEPELQWLAQELSRWLKLPISKITITD
jgi:serine/threonine protein kinase